MDDSTLKTLSYERTVLANERTLLAYIRTALAFLIMGVGIFKFLTNGYAVYLGTTAISMGALFIIVGIVLFVIRKRQSH